MVKEKKVKKEKKQETPKENKALNSAIDEIKERFGEGADIRVGSIDVGRVVVYPLLEKVNSVYAKG